MLGFLLLFTATSFLQVVSENATAIVAGFFATGTILINSWVAERRAKIVSDNAEREWSRARIDRSDMRLSIEAVRTSVASSITATNSVASALLDHAGSVETKLQSIGEKSDAAFDKANHFNEKMESVTDMVQKVLKV